MGFGLEYEKMGKLYILMMTMATEEAGQKPKVCFFVGYRIATTMITQP